MNYGTLMGLGNGLAAVQQAVGGYFANKKQNEQMAMKMALEEAKLGMEGEQLGLQRDQLTALTKNQQLIREQEEKRLLMEQAQNMAPGQYSAESVAPFREKGVYAPLFTENAHPGLPLATSLQSQGEAPAFDQAGDVSFAGVMPPALRVALTNAEQRAAAAEAMNDYRWSNLDRLERQGSQNQSTMASMIAALASQMNANTNQTRTGAGIVNDVEQRVQKYVDENFPPPIGIEINSMSPAAQLWRQKRAEAGEAYRKLLMSQMPQVPSPSGEAPTAPSASKSGLF